MHSSVNTLKPTALQIDILWFVKYISIKLLKKTAKLNKTENLLPCSYLPHFQALQQPHVASGYYRGEYRYTEHFQHHGKFYWTELLQDIKKQDKINQQREWQLNQVTLLSAKQCSSGSN